MRKFALFLLIFLVLALMRAPATLLDAAFSHTTGAGLRLLLADGSLWAGRGTLASSDPGGRSVTPWLPLAWQFEPTALLQGALRWRFTSDTRPVATVDLGLGGASVSELDLHTPANALLASLPHPIARAGWQGDLDLSASHWACAADGRCSGEARLLWRGARSALFPGRRFGDYEVRIQADRGQLQFTVATLEGEVRLDGRGSAAPGQPPRFDGQISGDADFLSRLPAIAGGAATPTPQAGRYTLHWPPGSR